LLEAAETVLERDGLPGLTLRAVAREAGVSHAAPTHHFGDLTGLVSELAAIGFRQFNAAMAAAGAAGARRRRRRWRGPKPMSPTRRPIPACTG
jgi:AcrR family transcriptional regulator